MGWIAGEEMDVCDSFTEEGMSTFEAGGRDGEKWMSVRKRRWRMDTSRGGTARGRNENDSRI
jgi:hypothetical protein